MIDSSKVEIPFDVFCSNYSYDPTKVGSPNFLSQGAFFCPDIKFRNQSAPVIELEKTFILF